MKNLVLIITLFAIALTAFVFDKSATPEDAKKVVKTFMQQIEFVINKNYSNDVDEYGNTLGDNQSKAVAKIKNLLENDYYDHYRMADDINGNCELSFNKYFNTKLAYAVRSGVKSYNVTEIKYLSTATVKAVDQDRNGEPVSYCIETTQQINSSKTAHFRFYVNIGSNKIGLVTLTQCSNNLPVAQTAAQSNTNAAINYTNGNINQAFNDYILALQLNPKDGEAYYRLAVMYYRGIGCKKNYKKVRECIAKAKLYGNPQIKKKAINFEEYIGR